MTAEDAAKHLQVHIKTGNERCIAADALRTVIELDRQIRRLRLELAVEMGRPVEGWNSTTVGDDRLLGVLWDVAVTRDPMGGGWRWIAEIDRGGPCTEVWAYGVASCKLGAMEAADAWLEGIPTPWERG